MSAYLRSLLSLCICGQPGVCQVIDKMGHARSGVWCKKCGEQLVRELDAADKPSPVETPRKGKRR